MDQQTEQAVWRRVKGPGPVNAGEALLPERLEALILEERSGAAALRELARRVGGQGRAALTGMAGQTEARAGRLETLHYLLTGRRLRLRTPRPGPAGPLPEALRAACLRMRQSAAAYEALAREFSSWEEELSRSAARARENARVLTGLLERQLRNSPAGTQNLSKPEK